MTYSEMENLLEEYREELRERRNRLLRARLARPSSQGELLARLGTLSSVRVKEEKGQISLTKPSAPSIMDVVR